MLLDGRALWDVRWLEDRSLFRRELVQDVPDPFGYVVAGV